MDPTCEITLVLADEFPNYSICGLPFFLSGETPDWHSLAHRTEFPGIRLMPNHTAESIDPVGKSVGVRDGNGTRLELRYDKLLIATGARPVQPNIDGFHLPGVFPLHTMEDSFAVHRFLEERRPKSVIIVGAGYIGLEMADALTHRGIASPSRAARRLFWRPSIRCMAGSLNPSCRGTVSKSGIGLRSPRSSLLTVNSLSLARRTSPGQLTWFWSPWVSGQIVNWAHPQA